MGLEWTYRVTSQPLRLGPRYARDGLTFVRLVFRALRRTSARSISTRSRPESQQSTDTTT